MTALTDAARPVLAAKAELRLDPITGEPILLYPEGMLHLNPSAQAILTLCDGTRSLADIVDHLTQTYEAPAETLRADVVECLDAFLKRQLILIAP
jgi:pyrroloquinoline quinone biosynthesis protein D